MEKRVVYLYACKRRFWSPRCIIIVNDVCEYDLIYILKVIIVEYTEVHI